MNTHLLSLSGIKKSFGAVKALSGVGLHLDAGELVSVVGENGAGKSTLMNIITGIVKPDDGQIFINGKEIMMLFTYVLSGVLCWVAAQMSVARFLTASPNYGMGWETTESSPQT